MKIAIIGSGNVAYHLAKALDGIAEVVNVNPRSLESLPSHSDIAIIAVKDDAIAEVAFRLKGKADILAHTSGSVPMDVLKGYAPAIGVFYPMQTFTKDVSLDYTEIPFFIEGDSSSTSDKLIALAKRISPNVHFADSEIRKRLHLAAVFSCNFTNRLIADADEILKEAGLDYTVLLPLIRQTVRKLNNTDPVSAQTGPAVRNDVSVMNKHLDMLSDDPYLSLLYRTISDRISEESKITSHKI